MFVVLYSSTTGFRIRIYDNPGVAHVLSEGPLFHGILILLHRRLIALVIFSNRSVNPRFLGTEIFPGNDIKL